MVKVKVLLLGVFLLGAFLCQVSFAQTETPTFVNTPPDINCAIQQVGVQIGYGPMVSVNCSGKDIALADDIIRNNSLSTKDFGIFHTVIIGSDITLTQIQSDKVESLRKYLKAAT